MKRFKMKKPIQGSVENLKQIAVIVYLEGGERSYDKLRAALQLNRLVFYYANAIPD
jgi:hypothetical protein